MPYCVACGHKNQDDSSYCASCGQTMATTAPQPASLTHVNESKTDGLRNATMIIGIVAALILLIGGCSGLVVGSFFDAAEDVLETEFDDPDDLATTESVTAAGGLAVFTSLVLLTGALLAKTTTRFSLIMLIIALVLLIISTIMDPVSLFALAYYITLLAVCTNVTMMFLVYRRTRNA